MEDKTTVAPLFLLYFLPHGRLVIPSSLEIHKKIKVTNSHDFHLSTNKIVEWKWLSNSDNHECLKTLRNIYCVVTNYNKVQGVKANHKTTN